MVLLPQNHTSPTGISDLANVTEEQVLAGGGQQPRAGDSCQRQRQITGIIRPRTNKDWQALPNLALSLCRVRSPARNDAFR